MLPVLLQTDVFTIQKYVENVVNDEKLTWTFGRSLKLYTLPTGWNLAELQKRLDNVVRQRLYAHKIKISDNYMPKLEAYRFSSHDIGKDQVDINDPVGTDQLLASGHILRVLSPATENSEFAAEAYTAAMEHLATFAYVPISSLASVPGVWQRVGERSEPSGKIWSV